MADLSCSHPAEGRRGTVRDFPGPDQCGECVTTEAVGPRVDCVGRDALDARDQLSRDKLRYVRPGDRNTPLKRASYIDKNDNEDDYQGELFPVDADDEAYDWDEAEDDGIAPRVVRDVKTLTAQEMEEHNWTHIPSQPWCPACVAGKKPNSPHKRQTEGEHLVP